MANEALLKQFQVGAHVKCRDAKSPYLGSNPPVHRVPVSDADVCWDSKLTNYAPPDYTDPGTIGKPWSDALIDATNRSTFKWHHIDGKIDRRSFVGMYTIDAESGRPLNPIGRTGLQGRGRLGKWGPNHAADPIVTRWKRDAESRIVKHSNTGKNILQFVAILRGDVRQWAIPGGMVDPGEAATETLIREFGEEACDSHALHDADKDKLKAQLAAFFKPEAGILVYKGYVDDPRNTDNAWMETVAMNFHDEDGTGLGGVQLKAGDDAVGIHWTDIDSKLELYASHKTFIEAVAQLHDAHW